MKIKPANTPGNVLVEMSARDENILASSAASEIDRFKISTIVVPIDFSPLSEKALQYAVAFSRKHEARLILVHVVEPVLHPNNYLGALPEVFENVNVECAKSARKKLAGLRESEIGLDIPSVAAVQTGRPYEEIINIAKERKADLIIIATHGHTGLKHVFLGSTAERVVRHAPCPVLVVREREREFV